MIHKLLDALFVICVLVSFAVSRSWLKRRNQKYPLPPRPKGLPIIGNLLDMLSTREIHALEGLRSDYGPIVHLKVLGTNYVYLNDYQLIVDLFEKRGGMYSSRPHLVMNDLEGWSTWFVGALPYGPELRNLRQKLHRFLQPSAIPSYFRPQTHSAHKLADRLIRKPEEFGEMVKHSVAELVMMITHGYEIEEADDPFVGIVEKGVEAFADAQGFYLVNDLPMLQYLPPWLPGMGFLKVAEEGYKVSMDMYKKPYEMFKKNFEEKGQGSSSLAAKLLESGKGKGDQSVDEDFVAKATSLIYAAGADTTVSALLTFILAMTLYPDVQNRAQEELDNVIGKNILPTFDDLPKLKYVNAIRKECLRWQNVVTLSNPHTVEVDDEINGYFIPANSVVFANIWSIFRDPSIYPEPERFIPERFIPSGNEEPPLDPGKIAFSVGRRHCPGKHFAESHTFIDMATLLATCNIEKAINDHGMPIIPKVEYTRQFVRHPIPFKCTIWPRNNEVLSLLRQTIETETLSND